MNSTLIQTDRFALSETERSAIEHELHHYEDPRAASIEALKIVQKERGWVPDGALYAIGEILGIPPGPELGEAYRFLLELRLDEGVLGPEVAAERLRRWWAGRSSA